MVVIDGNGAAKGDGKGSVNVCTVEVGSMLVRGC